MWTILVCIVLGTIALFVVSSNLKSIVKKNNIKDFSWAFSLFGGFEFNASFFPENK